MSEWRRWALLALVLALAAVAIRLGVWQLDRLSQRRAHNTLELAARDLPPVDLGTGSPGDSALPGRRVTATGHFEPSDQLLLRNRAWHDAPGVHVVTAFVADGSGAVVWVLRGFANAADAVHPAEVVAPTPGTVTIRGTLAALPATVNAGQPLASRGDTTWQRLDSAVAQRRRAGSLPAFVYLEGDEAGPGRLPAVEPPPLGEGPHLSYAIQWFGIATAILAFGAVFVRRRDGRGPARPPAAP